MFNWVKGQNLLGGWYQVDDLYSVSRLLLDMLAPRPEIMVDGQYILPKHRLSVCRNSIFLSLHLIKNLGSVQVDELGLIETTFDRVGY